MATDVVGSKMPQFASEQLKPSKAGYGQNQFGGASSDMPGEHTTSGFLPQVTAPLVNSQARTLTGKTVPDAVGMASARSRQPNPSKEGV